MPGGPFRARTRGHGDHTQLPPRFTVYQPAIDATVGVAVNVSIVAQGVPAPTITKTGSLPTGLTFTDLGGGHATITGTPTGATVATFTITATNTHGAVTVPVTITVTVSSNVAPVITAGGGTLDVVQGVAALRFVTATGTPAPTLSVTGSLPTGLTFADYGGGNGAISGTPTGTTPATVTVHATNTAGSDSTSLTIAITAATSYNVPSSFLGEPIDPTGVVDSSLGWQAWLNGRPANFTVNVPPTAVYLCDGTINVVGVSGLTINGNGAQWKAATFLGIDTETGVQLTAGGLPTLNRGCFTFTACPNITLNGLEPTGALRLGNLDGDYVLTGGLDQDTPNLENGRKTYAITRTDISIVRGNPDKIVLTGGTSWGALGFSNSDLHRTNAGIMLSGFSNSVNNGWHYTWGTPDVTSTEISLTSVNTLVTEASGSSRTVYRGNSGAAASYSMVAAGSQSTAFPGNFPRIHRASGSFVTDGWKPGMQFRAVGFAQTANIDATSPCNGVVAVTATDLYFAPFSGKKPVAESASVQILGEHNTGAYLERYETQTAFRFRGCLGIQVSNCTPHDFYGDAATFLGYAGNFCEDILIEGGTIIDFGRQGLAPGCVRRFVCRGVTFDRVRRTMVDFEPNGIGWGWEDCWVINNTFGSNILSGMNLKTFGEVTRRMVISGNTGIENIHVGGKTPKTPTGLELGKYDVFIVDNVLTNTGPPGIDVDGAVRFYCHGNTINGQPGRQEITVQFSHYLDIGGNDIGTGVVFVDPANCTTDGYVAPAPPDPPF